MHIFASDEYGFNPNHISHYFMLADVSPCEILELLKSWGRYAYILI